MIECGEGVDVVDRVDVMRVAAAASCRTSSLIGIARFLGLAQSLEVCSWRGTIEGSSTSTLCSR